MEHAIDTILLSSIKTLGSPEDMWGAFWVDWSLDHKSIEGFTLAFSDKDRNRHTAKIPPKELLRIRDIINKLEPYIDADN